MNGGGSRGSSPDTVREAVLRGKRKRSARLANGVVTVRRDRAGVQIPVAAIDRVEVSVDAVRIVLLAEDGARAQEWRLHPFSAPEAVYFAKQVHQAIPPHDRISRLRDLKNTPTELHKVDTRTMRLVKGFAGRVRRKPVRWALMTVTLGVMAALGAVNEWPFVPLCVVCYLAGTWTVPVVRDALPRFTRVPRLRRRTVTVLAKTDFKTVGDAHEWLFVFRTADGKEVKAPKLDITKRDDGLYEICYDVDDPEKIYKPDAFRGQFAGDITAIVFEALWVAVLAAGSAAAGIAAVAALLRGLRG